MASQGTATPERVHLPMHSGSAARNEVLSALRGSSVASAFFDPSSPSASLTGSAAKARGGYGDAPDGGPGLHPVHQSGQYIPIAPGWTLSRPFLTLSHLFEPRGADADDKPPPIGSFPYEVQELLVIEDLLSVLIGIDAKYLRMKGSTTGPGLSVRPDPSLDLSLADLVERVLPLSHYYVRVVKFIELRQHYEFGMVSHALCSALQELVREYLIFIAQLEHQANSAKLTLQKLWFYVQPAMQTLKALFDLVEAIEGGAKGSKAASRGGALLNVLHAHVAAAGGEQHARKLFSFLLQRSSVPYLEMLERWIYKGIVQDPYSEFMVEERPNRFNDDSYWEKRYVKRNEHVPSFLAEEEVVHKVMTTGKYLTVLRECGETQDFPLPQTLTYSSNSRVYAQLIDAAYQVSSARVLSLLTEQNHLMQRLTSVKHYFLLDRGDWFIHFMDIAHEELCKDVKNVNQGRLESALSLSLVTSVANNDGYKDDLTCGLMSSTALDEVLNVITIDGSDRTQRQKEAAAQDGSDVLSGLDAFTLSYKVEWPLNIILSRKTLTKYRWLFRHLFSYKVAERELGGAWLCHCGTKSFSVLQAFSLDFSLRARMLHFMQSLQHYLLIDVVEHCWHIFQENMRTASTVEEVLRIHDKLLDSCIKLFLLNDPHLLKMLTRTIATCLKFARYIKSKTTTFTAREGGTVNVAGEAVSDGDREETGGVRGLSEQRDLRRKFGEYAEMLAREPQHRETVEKYETEFDDKVAMLLESLRFSCPDPHLLNLCAQLDYNAFYSERAEGARRGGGGGA